MTDNPRALVTGACGFLGSAIVDALSDRGYEVVGIDRSPSSRGQRHYQLVLPDEALSQVLADEQPDVVVHTAGPASVADSVSDPLSDFRGSVLLNAMVLDAVRVSSPKAKVIGLSSAAVYGNPEGLPVTEDAKLAPISPYGYHKVLCESLVKEYAELYGVRTVALRIFSAYGAGLRRQLLWDVCEKARNDEVVRLFGTGDETRDFIHARDVATAVCVIAERARFVGEPYNVASGRETSVRELVTPLVERVAPGKRIEFSGEVRKGDPLRWRADVSRLGSLGFEPAISLEDGLSDFADWYLATTRTIV